MPRVALNGVRPGLWPPEHSDRRSPTVVPRRGLLPA